MSIQRELSLEPPPPEVALAGLRALRTVAAADGQLHDLETRFAAAVQAHILKTSFDFEQLAAISPEELAQAVPPPFRQRVLHACLLAALIDGEASEAELTLLHAFAAALGVKADAVRTAQKLVDDHLVLFRIDVLRRSFMGQRGADFVSRRGVRGLLSLARTILGIEDPAMAARYRALDQLPAGTLGHEWAAFIRKNGFSVPGEKGAGPEPIVFHDCLHVLAGYDTTSIEETQIAAFQAGALKKDAIYGLLFPLAQFHLGVAITPVTPAERGVIDPDLLLRAFVRGTKTAIDLPRSWQPWDDFEQPVEELRRRYNIEPRS